MCVGMGRSVCVYGYDMCIRVHVYVLCMGYVKGNVCMGMEYVYNSVCVRLCMGYVYNGVCMGMYIRVMCAWVCV